jgi:hypothetical protein
VEYTIKRTDVVNHSTNERAGNGSARLNAPERNRTRCVNDEGDGPFLCGSDEIRNADVVGVPRLARKGSLPAGCG